MDDIFADGIAEISVINGVARLTLMTLEPDRANPEAKPTPTARHRVAMPIQGLVSLVAQAQGLLAKLEQAGVVQRVAPDADGKPAAAKQPSKSPNF